MQDKQAITRVEGMGEQGDAAANDYRPHHRRRRRKAQVPKHGRVHGDVWFKSVLASSHMLRTPKGWALDVADIEAAEACDVRFVHVQDREQLCNYWAALSTLRGRGFELDRGFGKQIGLTLDHWRPTRQAAAAAAQGMPEREPEPAMLQGVLF